MSFNSFSNKTTCVYYINLDQNRPTTYAMLNIAKIKEKEKVFKTLDLFKRTKENVKFYMSIA